MRKRAGRPSERDALIGLLRRDLSTAQRASAIKGVDPERLAQLAIEQGVATLTLKRMAEIGVELPEKTSRELERKQVISTAARLHAAYTIASVVDVLDIPFVIVKGPVVAQYWGDDASEREYGDIDLLVRPTDFLTALASLEERGFDVLLDNWSVWLDEQVGEVPLGFECTMVDLHWSLIALGGVRRAFQLPETQMFERRTPAVLGTAVPMAVETLDTEDALLHLCVHAGLAGGRRLRNLLDVDAVLRHRGIDLEAFAVRARDAGADRMAVAILDRCQRLLGTPIPEELFDELGRRRIWRALNEWVDEAGGRRQTMIAPGIIVAASRASTAATSLALARNLRDGVVHHAGAPHPDRPGSRLDWNRTPSDGDVRGARQRYLQWVDGVGCEIHAG